MLPLDSLSGIPGRDRGAAMALAASATFEPFVACSAGGGVSVFAWRLGAIICGWPLLAAIYYPGLTDLAQGPHGRKSPNWHFVAPAKEGGGVLKTPTPLSSCLLHVACLAPSYLLPARMYNYNLLRANK